VLFIVVSDCFIPA